LFTIHFKQDNGLWSVPLTQFFIKTPPSVSGGNLTTYEYWIDNDRTNVVSQTVAAGQTAFSFDANTQNLQDGVHLFTIHFKQDNGLWSVPLTQFFIKSAFTGSGTNQIVAYDYWYDGDFANRQSANITPTAASIRLITDIPINLTQGFHKLYMRFKDTNGQWSNITVHPFSNFKRGVTVIVHGFSLFGSFPSDWVPTMAEAIKDRSGEAIIYKNDPVSSQWVLQGGDPTDTTREIILEYDWADLSNNGLSSLSYGGNGYLESAADNLFAMLLTVPVNLGSPTKILDRPIHFIGHSRGAILCLQVFHRLKKYFPSVDIKQFTAIDPHPATTFGDVLSTDVGSQQSLPGVLGSASDCGTNIGCLNGNSIYLQIPENVLSCDNYFRKDGDYEGVSDAKGAFDGVSAIGLSTFNRQLSESLIALPNCPFRILGVSVGVNMGGSHSKIHAWYYGTAKNKETPLQYSDCTDLSSDIFNQWYSPNIHVNQTLNENRETTGFNYSRLGGVSYPATPTSKATLVQMENALVNRTGHGLKPIFNGDFNYGDGGAGWIGNGGQYGDINNKVGRLRRELTRNYNFKHSYFYFAPEVSGNTIVGNYTWLRFKMKPSVSTSSRRFFIFFSTLTTDLPAIPATISFSNLDWRYVYCPIPNSLKGKVGTFEINDGENSNYDLLVDDFEFTNDAPTANDFKMADPVVLPVELTKFIGKCQDNKVALSWQTASEKNSLNFELLYSTSPQSGWKALATLPAKGNGSVLSDYNYLFENPTRLTYYRLRQVDKDGSFHYSPTIAVECAGKEHYLKVYPNPTTDDLNIETDINDGDLTIDICNAVGQSVLKKQYSSGFYPINIALTGLSSGVYFVKVSAGNSGVIGVKQVILNK
jgi:hypothetical protein